MNTHQLEPGGVYRGLSGQTREIISLFGSHITYRIHEVGMTSHPATSGEVREGVSSEFAKWAVEEVA